MNGSKQKSNSRSRSNSSNDNIRELIVKRRFYLS